MKVRFNLLLAIGATLGLKVYSFPESEQWQTIKAQYSHFESNYDSDTGMIKIVSENTSPQHPDVIHKNQFQGRIVKDPNTNEIKIEPTHEQSITQNTDNPIMSTTTSAPQTVTVQPQVLEQPQVHHQPVLVVAQKAQLKKAPGNNQMDNITKKTTPLKRKVKRKPKHTHRSDKAANDHVHVKHGSDNTHHNRVRKINPSNENQPGKVQMIAKRIDGTMANFRQYVLSFDYNNPHNLVSFAIIVSLVTISLYLCIFCCLFQCCRCGGDGDDESNPSYQPEHQNSLPSVEEAPRSV